MPRKNKANLTREDLEEIIEPLAADIQELKSHANLTDSRLDKMDSRFDKIDSRFDKIDSRLDHIEIETRQSGILLEQMNKKIDLALDVSKLVVHHETVTLDHEHRLKNVESEVQIIRQLSRPKE